MAQTGKGIMGMFSHTVAHSVIPRNASDEQAVRLRHLPLHKRAFIDLLISYDSNPKVRRATMVAMTPKGGERYDIYLMDRGRDYKML